MLLQRIGALRVLTPSRPTQARHLGSMAASASHSRDPVVQALQDYTTCDVSDALCKLDKVRYRHGGFLPGLSMWSPLRQAGPTKIVGPAYTVKYLPLDDPAGKHPTHYIDSVPEGAVVFVSSPPKTSNAVYGGLMSMRAQASGAVGSVIDGRFRDLQEQRELGFPIFARDVGTAPPAPVLKVAGVNVPVTLQSDEHDIEIRPGDYIVADMNGVVVLPAEVAEQALPLMKRQVEMDDQMAVAIKGGMSFVEASKKFRS
ncbi:ribonuclease E inhibitor RraA/Dimethylmenaquinone methyltransferase [Microdochium bolleyi]|uniref:Ribonuclease E inhibitor RraA/Dimethylmenaquinone methyltransferase n=1 Tax=Microdochium bolleyi TaxID=196109 RepID=A0A136JAG7_9PEZI|nr:ribonuclease E inhibitor RraA/Dimethylmenaquinone methyltransferase [Microdochium bolleyi]